MPEREFQTYFQRRAGRFAAFYSSEPVARVLGRGPLFDRLELAVDTARSISATRVLDVGCGSGPLFAPLAAQGIHGDRYRPGRGHGGPGPANRPPSSRASSRWSSGAGRPSRTWTPTTWPWPSASSTTSADPVALLTRMGRAAPHVVGSFPAPGLRLLLRKVRYGARGVGVHGYRADGFERLAEPVGLEVAGIHPLGRAGFVAHFRRPAAPRVDGPSTAGPRADPGRPRPIRRPSPRSKSRSVHEVMGNQASTRRSVASCSSSRRCCQESDSSEATRLTTKPEPGVL